MDDIKDIIRSVMGGLSGASPAGGSAEIQKIWEKVVEEKARGHAKIAGLKNGVLYIAVDSPAWLYDFKLRKKKILDGIRRESPGIEDVNFKIGKTT